jgi:peptidoglycan/LPS O-acetylase OafA/YrhL
VSQRDARRRHAVSLVDAAGLTILLLGSLVIAEQVVSQIFGGFLGGVGPDLTGGPAGWELVLLAFAFGLIAYGCVDRERVPAFLGVLVLVLFLFMAFQPGEDGPSLIGWPLVLLAMAGALLVIGLRPREELPPEPEVPHA